MKRKEKCFFCHEMIETEVEHFFQMTVRNNGGEDHKEKRFMCYNCESRLRHQSKCDVNVATGEGVKA